MVAVRPHEAGRPRQLRLPLPMTPVSDPADFAEYEAQWGRVRDALRSEFGDAAFIPG
ncbi:hypothetical protein ACFQ4K_11560 [Tistrella bauzanensis]